MSCNQQYRKPCCYEERKPEDKKPEVKKPETCKPDWKEDYCKCYCKCLTQRPYKTEMKREEVEVEEIDEYED